MTAAQPKRHLSDPLDSYPSSIQQRVNDLAEKGGLPVNNVLVDLIELALDLGKAESDDDSTNSDDAYDQDWSCLLPDDLVTPKQAGRRLRRATSTLAKLRCHGTGPPYVKLGSRSVFYKKKDVDAFRDAHIKFSTSDD